MVRPLNLAQVFKFFNRHFRFDFLSFNISEGGWVILSANNFPIPWGSVCERNDNVEEIDFAIFLYRVCHRGCQDCDVFQVQRVVFTF